ncbi:chemotaxis protein CheC [Bacillus sp. 03113]|uniref:chemotaxis protein CheC n=1 Tax=Bacillus sp. 03113 TaxID=2578211 RepID=UPI0011449AE1|nr:chemotaxis protein CheC [Bacillus sp. 03113]
MRNIEKITLIHLDILREIGNIGAGNAATSLSKLLNQKIDMKVPSVKVVSFNEMMEMEGGAENIVAGVFLRIEGDAPGSMFFVLPIKQASIFIQRMIGDPLFTFETPPYDELGVSALQELGNILAGSYLSSLSDFTNLSLYPSVPGLSIDMFGAIISTGLIEVSQVSDYAIVVDTAIFDDESNFNEDVNGRFFLLPDPSSFEIIFKSLGVAINER